MDRKKWAVLICDPAPWERGHHHRIPFFVPLWTNRDPDTLDAWFSYENWLAPRGASIHIPRDLNMFFWNHVYWTYNKQKAETRAAKVRLSHPHLIVRVDEHPE